jgi:hypothetical protein
VVSDLIPVLWLCGPPGIGKSTVGWEIFTQLTQAGIEAGYVDIDQLGMCYPEHVSDPGRHRVKTRNLAAAWQTYRAAGVQCLIAVGPVENDAAAKAYAAALPHAAITLCRLHCGADELTRRIMLRGPGGSWPQPGDPLAGQPTIYLLRAAASAAADAEALEHAEIGALRIDTGRLSVAEAADVIAARTGWPRPAG